MDTTVILIVVAAAAALWSFVLLGKTKSANQRASEEAASKQAVEAKLNGLRQEISALKDENQRKSKALEEARESAKKKLRKEAQKTESDNSGDDSSADTEAGRLKRTLAAMESQIRAMKEESEQSVNNAKSALEAAYQKQLSSLNEQIEKLEEQLSAAKGETNRRRQNLSKQMSAPVDLTALPTEVVSELARLLRKAEQHEKMHGILQGKHQLAQERYQELQRRYFAVCRELALVALPNGEATDEQARQLAESVVEASDARTPVENVEAPHNKETPSESLGN